MLDITWKRRIFIFLIAIPLSFIPINKSFTIYLGFISLLISCLNFFWLNTIKKASIPYSDKIILNDFIRNKINANLEYTLNMAKKWLWECLYINILGLFIIFSLYIAKNNIYADTMRYILMLMLSYSIYVLIYCLWNFLALSQLHKDIANKIKLEKQ